MENTEFLLDDFGACDEFMSIARIGVIEKTSIDKITKERTVTESYIATDLCDLEPKNFLSIKLSHWNIEAGSWMCSLARTGRGRDSGIRRRTRQGSGGSLWLWQRTPSIRNGIEIQHNGMHSLSVNFLRDSPFFSYFLLISSYSAFLESIRKRPPT